MLELLHPVLTEDGEKKRIATVRAVVLRHGTGAQHQRQGYATRHDPRDVVVAALRSAHRGGSIPPMEVPPTLDGLEEGTPEALRRRPERSRAAQSSEVLASNNQQASLLQGSFPCYRVCTENDRRRRRTSGIHPEELT